MTKYSNPKSLPDPVGMFEPPLSEEVPAEWIEDNKGEIIDVLIDKGFHEELIEWYVDEFYDDMECQDEVMNGLIYDIARTYTLDNPLLDLSEIVGEYYDEIEKKLMLHKRTITGHFLNEHIIGAEHLPEFVGTMIDPTIDEVYAEYVEECELNDAID
jgi:hypothetical protein